MAKDIRVLVVDDDSLAREIITRKLDLMKGYAVVGEALDGRHAIEMTQELRPDVVVMDIRIPVFDGIEAARRITDQCPTPVVILSAFETPDLVRRASEAGVGAYLIKPPDTKDMERAIAMAMARFQDMMELRRLNQDLRARNEDLDAFAHTVAHDLQNPLALVVGFAESLRRYRDTLSAADFETCVANIERSGRKMSQVVNQLLLLAESRKMAFELVELDTAHLVSKALARLGTLIEQRRATFDLPTEWPAALGQSMWVEEVWVSALSYMIQHGPKTAPHLAIRAAEQDGNRVLFQIRDASTQTVPPKEDELPVSFPEPIQAEDSPDKSLELALVSRVVEKLGGKADVARPEGGNLVLSFTLPGSGSA